MTIFLMNDLEKYTVILEEKQPLLVDPYARMNVENKGNSKYGPGFKIFHT